MIPVRNIYYMLSYAFQVLNEQGYKKIATESFDNVADLCAAILCRGISVQVKRGLGRDYIEKTEELSCLRGKINISESIKPRVLLKRQLICEHDEFSVNSYLNQIIKTTAVLLLRSGNVSKDRKKELRKLMIYFNEVDVLDSHSIRWNVQYNKNNQTYRMLISVCYLVIKGLLQTQSDGSTKLMDFLDEQRMCRLYEKFILEYYRKEHKELAVSNPEIKWQVDDGFDDLLPKMKTDIVLEKNDKILIIDAKYYSHITQVNFDTHSIHSGNIYQIFTYVKNLEGNNPNKTVSGMLLYAKTDEEITPSHTYQMQGNQISAKTLDLNLDFAGIRKQLDSIAEEF